MTTDNSIVIALSSAAGSSDRGIIRFSGKGCIELVASICQNKEKILSGKGFYCYFSRLDALEIPIFTYLYLMRAPASYTREDMIELHLIGSPYILSKLITFFISTHQCRIAEPGEFTKRAFFNGRLDLLQAESVTRLIAAKSDREYRKALDALTGRVTNMISPVREKLFILARNLTVDLDFDEEIENEHIEAIQLELLSIKAEMKKVSATSEYEQSTNDIYCVILVGPVNAGKSTIFNQFSAETVSIVSDIKGTTRDIIKREIHSGANAFTLLDCPGWGEAVDELDALAQAQSSISIETADMVICVLDGTIEFAKQKPSKAPQWQGRGVLVVNKCDLPTILNVQEAVAYFQWNQSEVVYIAGKENINDLQNKVNQKWAEFERSAIGSILNARQQFELLNSLQALDLALDAIKSGIGIDAIEFEVRRALYSLSRVTGDEVDENILTSIFSSFCIGK
jgi:tRNA modification GTPase